MSVEKEAIEKIQDPNLRGCFELAIEAREAAEAGNDWKRRSFARVLMQSRRFWAPPSVTGTED